MKRSLVTVLGVLIIGGMSNVRVPAQNPLDEPLPPLAVVGSTSQRAAAYNGMTQAQRSQMFAIFRANKSPITYANEAQGAPVTPLSSLVCRKAAPLSDPNDWTFIFEDIPDDAPMAVTPPPTPETDSDLDGLGDSFEKKVSNQFKPIYAVSGDEPAGTRFATFQNSSTLTIAQLFNSYPVIDHYRVTKIVNPAVPGGFVFEQGIPYGYLQIDYMTIWNRDDGFQPSALCATLTAGFGLAFDGLGSHAYDVERSAALVAAPAITVNGALKFNTDSRAYKSYSYYLAAHEGVALFDQSDYYLPPNGEPAPAGFHPYLFLSRSKHATYPRNPHGRSLFQREIRVQTYADIYAAYLLGLLSPVQYLGLLYAADTLFYGCATEAFAYTPTRLGYAGTRKNVGELARPINSSPWINDTGATDPNRNVRGKLDPPLWCVCPYCPPDVCEN
jgi:hypothetical protein